MAIGDTHIYFEWRTYQPAWGMDHGDRTYSSICIDLLQRFSVRLLLRCYTTKGE